MADASQGAQSRWYVEPGASTHTFDANSETYEFLSENVKKTGVIIDNGAIRGTRSHHSITTRPGPYTVGGTVRFNPSPASLDLWLPRILGSSESNDSFTLAETLPAFGVLFDRVYEQFQYTDCKVNRATFRGNSGGALVELELDIIGKTEITGTNAPAVSLSTAANAAPYVFHEGVLTLVSSARNMKDFELVIDNSLDARFTNSQTATSITPRDRVVTLRTTNPFTSDESGLYGQSNAGTTGTLVFTNGNMSTTFTFGVLQVPDNSPVVGGKEEINLTLEMVARMTGSTRELVVTHDSTA